jgi:glycosyltransferase involved in cell wall biosynthesis
MRLLIVTQVVDRNHPILGFFHGWIEEFAKQCSEVRVVGLSVGTHAFPENTHVYSLGKEQKPASAIVYAFRLIGLSWKLRKEYDVVFVHMNPEYVIAAGWLWRLLGKEIRFWYAHGAISLRLRIASILSHRIFTSTPGGYRLPSKKLSIVGQGINIEHFSPASAQSYDAEQCRLITVGRIAASKRLETLIRALATLRERGVPATLTIAGVATTDSEHAYEDSLRKLVTELKIGEYTHFVGPQTQDALPTLLRQHDFFVSDGATGSLDKALIEGAACGLMVISSNQAFAHLMTREASETVVLASDHKALANAVATIEQKGHADKMQILNSLKSILVTPNSISALIKKILA